MSLKSRIMKSILLQEIITSNKDVFKDLESDMAVRNITLLDPTRTAGKSNDKVKWAASS
jgi:hypothetical protein